MLRIVPKHLTTVKMTHCTSVSLSVRGKLVYFISRFKEKSSVPRVATTG